MPSVTETQVFLFANNHLLRRLVIRESRHKEYRYEDSRHRHGKDPGEAMPASRYLVLLAGVVKGLVETSV